MEHDTLEPNTPPSKILVSSSNGLPNKYAKDPLEYQKIVEAAAINHISHYQAAFADQNGLVHHRDQQRVDGFSSNERKRVQESNEYSPDEEVPPVGFPKSSMVLPDGHSYKDRSIYEKPVSYASLSSLPPTPQTGTSSSPAANEQDFYDSNSITVPDESTAVGIMVEMKPNSRPTSWFCNISIPFSTTCGELIDELGARIVAAHPRVPHGILWTIRIRVVWNQWQLKPNIIKQMEGKQNFNYFNNLHQQVKDPRIWEKVRRFATLTNLDEDEYKQILIEMSRNDYEEKRLLVDYRMTGFKNNRIVLERDFEGKIRKSTYTLQVELLHGAWINRTQQLIF